MADLTEIELIKKYGLFAVVLNSSEWMVGKANYIYHIDVVSNHYEDDQLSISPVLMDAIVDWLKRN